jgi:hypothetical protein
MIRCFIGSYFLSVFKVLLAPYGPQPALFWTRAWIVIFLPFGTFTEKLVPWVSKEKESFVHFFALPIL